MPNAPEELRPDLLRQEINQMIQALSHPAYVEAMRRVRETPREQRLVAGSRLLNPDALRAAGVPLPDNMRISSRYFDEDVPRGVEFGDPPGRETNLVNTLNETEPGLLDRLAAENPSALNALLVGNESDRFMATAGCCCGGAASACGGCGG